MEHENVFKSVDEFFSNVGSEEIVELEGFLERDEARPGWVRLAPYGDCARWISLSNSSVIRVQVVRRAAVCFTEKDGYHTHPYVRVEVDPNKADTIQALAGLLKTLLVEKRMVNRSAAQVRTRPASHKNKRFRLKPFDLGDCKDGERCVGGVSQCDYGCACCDDDDMCYCSSCCIA